MHSYFYTCVIYDAVEIYHAFEICDAVHICHAFEICDVYLCLYMCYMRLFLCSVIRDVLQIFDILFIGYILEIGYT